MHSIDALRSSSFGSSSTEAYRQLACLLAARSIAQDPTKQQSASAGGKDSTSSAAPRVATKPDTSNERYGGDDRMPAAVEVAQYLLPRHPGFVPASILLQQSSQSAPRMMVVEYQQPSVTAEGASTNIEPQRSIDSIIAASDAGSTAQSPTPPAAAAAAATNRRETYVPVCQECGGALEPGGVGAAVGTARMRVHATFRLSRSARRRASRRKARALKRCNHTSSWKDYDDDPTKRQSDSNLWRYTQDPQRRSFDCLANYLQITCGHCGAISRLAGRPNPRPMHQSSRQSKKQQPGAKAQKKGATSSSHGPPRFLGGDTQRQPVLTAGTRKRKEASGPTALEKNNNTAGGTTTLDDDEDFLALGPAAKPAKRKKEAPKLGQPLKKKKKKKPGDLLNFLSSLND